MPAMDFPTSPAEGDTFAAGSNLWQFDGGQWVIIPYGVPKDGVIDGGRASGAGNYVFVDAGIASSVFTATMTVNGGNVSGS